MGLGPIRDGTGWKLQSRRVHPLEGLNMMGFGPDAFVKPPLQTLEHGQLQMMLGNMWSLYHFVPMMIAAVGVIDWERFDEKPKEEVASPTSEPGEGGWVDGSESESHSD